MKNIILFTISFFTIYSCSNNDDNPNNDIHNATVLSESLDCSDNWLIQFIDDTPNIPDNDTNNIFYAINLPEEYESEGLNVYIEFRTPNDDELLSCSTQGISYPQIYILPVD